MAISAGSIAEPTMIATENDQLGVVDV